MQADALTARRAGPAGPWHRLRRGLWGAGMGAVLPLLLAAATALVAGAAAAQAFTSRPVRVLLPFSAGSGPDSLVRQIGETASQSWGQPLVVDNKPGGNGWLAIAEAKRSAPDGHTLLALDSTHGGLQPLLYKQLPFDLAKDFEPVAPLYATWFFIVVAAGSPWQSVTDLLQAARSKPGGLSYGSSGLGSVPHVGAAMLEAAAQVHMTHVPYKDQQQIYTDVATGRIDWAFGTAATADGLVKARKVRLLALAAPQRLPAFGDVPTVAQAGGPAGFELKTWVALYAPRGLPPALRERLHADLVAALADPALGERMGRVGFQPWPGAPGDVTRATEAELARFKDIVKGAHIALD